MTLPEVMRFTHTRTCIQKKWIISEKGKLQNQYKRPRSQVPTDNIVSALPFISMSCLMLLLLAQCTITLCSLSTHKYARLRDCNVYVQGHGTWISFCFCKRCMTGGKRLMIIVNRCHMDSYWLTCRSLTAEIQATTIASCQCDEKHRQEN